METISKNPKVRAAQAQAAEVFDYFSRKGMDVVTFKEYVKISDTGEIKIALPSGRTGSPMLAAAIKLQFDLIIEQDKQEALKLASVVLNTIR